MSDELRPIPGFDGYSITRDGRVWSHPKSPPPGKAGNRHNGMWMRTWESYGQPIVRLYRDRQGYKRCTKTLIVAAWRTSREITRL